MKIPALIKRNVALFSASQSFTGAGMQFSYGFGPLMVVALTQSPALAGLSVGLVGVSRFLVAYPIGRITDKHGRKTGIYLGLALALAGSLALGTAMLISSIALFIIGMLTFGMGMNGAQQMRVGVTDMFPARMRAEALGYLALGSLFSLAISPLLVQLADVIAQRTGAEPLGMPWFFLPVLILTGAVLVAFVRPDPKEIGMNLQAYWPELPPNKNPEPEKQDSFSARQLLADPSIRLAILSNCAGTGNMSIVMVLTSLVLHDHGHSLFAIAVSHTFHSAGMFAFTIPLGATGGSFRALADHVSRCFRLADRSRAGRACAAYGDGHARYFPRRPWLGCGQCRLNGLYCRPGAYIDAWTRHRSFRFLRRRSDDFLGSGDRAPHHIRRPACRRADGCSSGRHSLRAARHQRTIAGKQGLKFWAIRLKLPLKQIRGGKHDG